MPIIPLLAECPCGFLLKTTVTAALSLSLSLSLSLWRMNLAD